MNIFKFTRILAICLSCLTIRATGCLTEENAQGITDFLGNINLQGNRDSDGDGIINVVDNCPDVPNADGQDKDIDRDGLGDVCDLVNDLDSDGDKILDQVDNCYIIPNPDQTDGDGDGFGDVCDLDDVDGDTIIDAVDNCPNVYNPSQAYTFGGTITVGDRIILVGDACYDGDQDGVYDTIDNCRGVGDGNQADPDGDGNGNPCDDDDDGDRIPDISDNCPLIHNPSQINSDIAVAISPENQVCPAEVGIAVGNACDNDDDNDLVLDDVDNCPNHCNPRQIDKDGDSLGDACDSIDDERAELIDDFEEALRTTSAFGTDKEHEPMRTTTPMQEVSYDETPQNSETNRIYNCTVTEYEATAGYNELFLLNPTSSVIYPGAILDGTSIQDGRYVLLSGGIRRPIDISVSILGTSSGDVTSTKVSGTVSNPDSLAKVREALNGILTKSENDGLSPPQVSQLTTQIVSSESSFGLSFGVNISGSLNPSLNFAFGSDFSLNASDRRETYMTRYAHRYYTVDVDAPIRPGNFYERFPALTSSITPVYVASVTYGRMVFIEMNSTRSSQEIRAALSASVEAFRVTTESELATQHRNVFLDSETKVTVLGGASSVGLTDASQLGEYINNAGSSYLDGIPIAYTLRFLSDGSIARTTLSSRYNVRQCDLDTSSRPKDVSLQVLEFSSSDNDGEGNREQEIFGSTFIRATSLVPGSYNHGSNCGAIGVATIANVERENTLKVGRRWLNVEHYNYRGTLTLTGQQVQDNYNIMVCSSYRDHDSNSGSDFLGSAAYVYPVQEVQDSSKGRPINFQVRNGSSYLNIRVFSP